MNPIPPIRATPRPECPMKRMSDRVLDAIVCKHADQGQKWREAQKLAAAV